jgi:hypothetical protein
MKKTSTFVLCLVIILTALSLPHTGSADKSFHIHSPTGAPVTLLITTCALKNIRIHDLEFSNNGDTFSVEAAPNGSSDSIESVSIEFREGSTSLQNEVVNIGPGRTVQEVYCPESFDQIVIDCLGY